MQASGACPCTRWRTHSWPHGLEIRSDPNPTARLHAVGPPDDRWLDGLGCAGIRLHRDAGGPGYELTADFGLVADDADLKRLAGGLHHDPYHRWLRRIAPANGGRAGCWRPGILPRLERRR